MSTLDELLADDGFKREGYKQKLLHREDRAASIAASFPNSRHGFPGSKPRPARVRSDVYPRRSLPMTLEKGGFTKPRSGDALARPFSPATFGKEQLPELQVRGSRVFSYSKESKESEGSFSNNRGRFSSIEEPDVACKSGRVIWPKDRCSEDFRRKLGFNWSNRNELYEDEEKKGKRTQNLLKPSFKDDGDKFPVPALDETTLKAVFLKINSCISDLLEDESFRLSVNQSCVSSLNSSGMKDTQTSVNGVLSTLKEAIETVERMITEGFTKLELKKTSLKLSVITGLKSMVSDDIYFCGISLSHLAACAHLYLSILYKIKKKDSVSAKHLMQVFFHSPYQARTALLPELWESLFLPHLFHLKAWHDRELASLQGTSAMKSKLEFLEKLSNDLLDSGTSNFAAFYKGYLTEGYKSPALTSVLIPFASFTEIREDDYESVSPNFSGSSYSVPSKATISKIPFKSVLNETKRIQTTDGMESRGEEKQSDVWRQYQARMPKDEETSNQSCYLGSYSSESFQEYYSAVSNDFDASSEDSDIDANPSRARRGGG